MKYIALIGRIFFSLIFLLTCRTLFSSAAVERATSAGVPMAPLLVPLACIIAIIGGLSVALGYKVKAGAWLIVIFLVPVTLFMHTFWKEGDAMHRQMQTTEFLKNLSMLGGALLIINFGSGPLSLDSLTHTKIKVKGFVKETDEAKKTTGPKPN